MNLSNLFAFILILFLSIQVAMADGILLAWSSSNIPGINEQSFKEAQQWSVDEILSKNIKTTSWPEAYLLMVGAFQHREDKNLLKGLISQITDTTKSNLKFTGRLIIWERITNGEIEFEGKGYQCDDDLFSISGRSNWILRNLTKKKFGFVRPDSSKEELTLLQQKWTSWLNGEKVEEQPNQYISKEKVIEEISSIQALEALIISLKPTNEKEKLTKDCLKNLYKLNEMPTDPGSPAALCNPDAYTNGYLALITGISDPYLYDWWQEWWNQNKKILQWDSEKGKFHVQPLTVSPGAVK
jgi:hypothetical protein